MVELEAKEGEFLVNVAREAIREYLEGGTRLAPPKDAQAKMLERAGVFVTIKKLVGEERQLRGCVGSSLPEKPLMEALIEAAIASATQDVRFPPLSKEELEGSVIEVSVLTQSELLQVNSPKEYPFKIRLGRDGLIVRWSLGSGLLLPQVPIEYGLDAEEFLSQACMKAGGTPDLWLLPGTKVYRFQAVVFEEVGPRGPVVKKDQRAEIP